MKSPTILNSIAILSFGLILFGHVGCGSSKSAQANAETRAIRTDGNASPVLPAPTDVTVLEGDQQSFDSFVYSVEKLKENYNSVVVLDARDETTFNTGHLPNAVRATWQEWSDVSVKQDSGAWAVILSNDKLSAIFGSLGIDGTKPVVIYTDTLAGWGEEGRQLWAFRVFGLTNTFILNGGIQAWKDAGGQISTDATSITPVTGPVPNPNTALFADTSYVAARVGKVNILDAREDQEYAGTTNYGEVKNGRIPTSKHVWFKDYYNSDGTLLTPAQVRARVEALGFHTADEVILYCTGGIRSGFSTMLLQISGYSKARNYNASFSAWAGTSQQIDGEVYTTLETKNNLY
jgi:thiosulfate/3-mercaptopyruvate sulfurtransferase